MSVPTIGGPGYHISVEEFEGFVADEIGKVQLEGKNLVLIIPDDTRGCPMPRILRAVYKAVINRAANVKAVIALGTHEYMEPDEIALWTAGSRDADLAAEYPGMPIVNHLWKDHDALVNVGHISAQRISELSGGRLEKAPMC